ncbi:hypothetical protein GCM10010967_43300 [Dyadobacter beijingensis]|uniref:DUF4377 domain-containing protein n=1 Tax=Dyadobacter beijingensis TaxID=365489 RepID=A0ABQ2IBP2_9BACT|nr:hypothetical protein [Dyadobacter beijingensis]GGN03795.1 hypothetical protein GCM10010967_43300 [Dyadobacter beijingensis]
MKHYTTLKLLALASVFVTAMAFSCQDHHIPDPVTNCNRVDGTPRALNCEFEFVKAEFYTVDRYPDNPPRYDTIVYATATPASPKVSIEEPRYAAWIVSSVSLLYYIDLPVRVTIRRIAPKPAGTTGYLLRKDFAAGGPSNVEYPTYGGSLPPDEDLTPVNINIPVGGTFTYNTGYIWYGAASDKPPYINYGIDGGNNYFLVQNIETSKLLRQAPYNYQFYRDMAEAKLLFHPYIIPSDDPF